MQFEPFICQPFKVIYKLYLKCVKTNDILFLSKKIFQGIWLQIGNPVPMRIINLSNLLQMSYYQRENPFIRQALLYQPYYTVNGSSTQNADIIKANFNNNERESRVTDNNPFQKSTYESVFNRKNYQSLNKSIYQPSNRGGIFFPLSRYENKMRLKQLDNENWKREKDKQERYKLEHFGADALRYSSYSTTQSFSVDHSLTLKKQNKRQKEENMYKNRIEQQIRKPDEYMIGNNQYIYQNNNANNINKNKDKKNKQAYHSQYQQQQRLRQIQKQRQALRYRQRWKQMQIQRQKQNQRQNQRLRERQRQKKYQKQQKFIDQLQNAQPSHKVQRKDTPSFQNYPSYMQDSFSKNQLNNNNKSNQNSHNVQHNNHNNSLRRYENYVTNSFNSTYQNNNKNNQINQLYTNTFPNQNNHNSYNNNIRNTKYQENQRNHTNNKKTLSDSIRNSIDGDLVEVQNKYQESGKPHLKGTMSYGSNQQKQETWQNRKFYDSDYINQDDDDYGNNKKGPLNAMRFQSSFQSGTRQNKPIYSSSRFANPYTRAPQIIYYQDREFFKLNIQT